MLSEKSPCNIGRSPTGRAAKYASEPQLRTSTPSGPSRARWASLFSSPGFCTRTVATTTRAPAAFARATALAKPTSSIQSSSTSVAPAASTASSCASVRHSGTTYGAVVGAASTGGSAASMRGLAGASMMVQSTRNSARSSSATTPRRSSLSSDTGKCNAGGNALTSTSPTWNDVPPKPPSLSAKSAAVRPAPFDAASTLRLVTVEDPVAVVAVTRNGSPMAPVTASCTGTRPSGSRPRSSALSPARSSVGSDEIHTRSPTATWRRSGPGSAKRSTQVGPASSVAAGPGEIAKIGPPYSRASGVP